MGPRRGEVTRHRQGSKGLHQGEGLRRVFGHGTGHGVGLDVREGPRISPVSAGTVSEGMVFTIEPGIYIPGRGGVRIEDMVLVRGGAAQTLTGLGRALEIVRA
ncbi:MAG: M24 family metallopeptidase [Desulfobacterales bacterium]|nr:M24 family metallopeptidase [Desulfobacterales bacterium]